MRLWPDTLAGRTLALLIGTTALLIIASTILLHDERKERFDERNLFHLADRVATLARLLGDADDAERRRIIARFSSDSDHIGLNDSAQVTGPSDLPLEKRIRRKLLRTLQITNRSSVRVAIKFEHRDRAARFDRHDRHPPKRDYEVEEIEISILMWDKVWLNIETKRFDGPPPLDSKTLRLLALLLAVLIIIGLIISRRMAQPMAQLADAADRFGLGHTQSPLPEKGPREVRRTIRAFNRMQQRLHKHITDRAQMLAAVSHDLRTPITTLRLRAEYIEDQEMREKTFATLAEMEAILSATLSFSRDEAADETSRATDLGALLQSIVDDHVDLGGDALYLGPDKLIFTCRPVALKRALNNLIDNAIKYGKHAAVGLSRTSDEIEIRIDDKGSGIPEDKLEQVFTPFFRLEASRSRQTGGTGLGLAVAKSIVLAHGGRLSLSNRPEGGLQALIQLPLK